MDLKLPATLGSAELPEVILHLRHADGANSTPIRHCEHGEHGGKVEMFTDFAFEVVPSDHLDVTTHQSKGHYKAIVKAKALTDTICLVFKAMGSCRKSMLYTFPLRPRLQVLKTCTSLVSDDGNHATSRRWLLRLETGSEQQDIKLQVFATLKHPERLAKDRKRGHDTTTMPQVEEEENRQNKVKRCMELYHRELQAMPDSVLDWELQKLNSHQFPDKSTR